jgi:hypothetical protein
MGLHLSLGGKAGSMALEAKPGLVKKKLRELQTNTTPD